jgi:hypothetical protein
VAPTRETRHVADRAYDPRSQDRSYAEDLGEGGARGFHLGFDAPVEVGDLPLQRPNVAQHLRRQPPAQAGGSTLRPNATQDARGPLGRERSGYPAGHEIPQERVETV